MMDGLQLRRLDGRGRCVFAERKFKCGEILFYEEPYAFVVCSSMMEVCCSFCGKICTNSIYQLSAADSCRYCSEECITADYSLHTKEISAITAIADAEVEGRDESMRLLMRIACLRMIEKSTASLQKPSSFDVPKVGRLNSFETIMSLEAISAHLSASAKQDVAQIAAFLSQTALKSGLTLSSSESEMLLYAIQCNAHQVLGPGRQAIGLGLFPMTSMLNHSCLPNCSHSFLLEERKFPKLVMRAIRDIAVGEELCYSYVELYTSTASRRQKLESAYGFRCYCQRCAYDSTRDSPAGELVECHYPLKTFPPDDVIDSVDFEDDSFVLAAQMIKSSLNNAAAALQRAEREMQPTISSASSTSSKQSEFATNRVLLRKSVCTAELAEDVESAYSSLLMTTSSSMMSTLHPCHKLFMLAYATLPRLALIKLNSNIFEDDGEEVGNGAERLQVAWLALRFALLALGCVVWFTGAVRDAEVADLQILVAQCLVALRAEARHAPDTTAELTSQDPPIQEEIRLGAMAAPATTRSQFTEIMLSLQDGMVWGCQGDLPCRFSWMSNATLMDVVTAACEFVSRENNLPRLPTTIDSSITLEYSIFEMGQESSEVYPIAAEITPLSSLHARLQFLSGVALGAAEKTASIFSKVA